ncbi:hypothetical protein ACFOY4_31190 [Actinomadura syzygii]|uniref:Carboxypeptidase regulatory-like domain-containing protein n=1 Tax=Actinomadura syzygii TaxID=1427538 RepID=A0A5D0UE68_9ACTN|nr:hypothetical protein [Actinomadura syzygii]TYC15399.1 hypothetical protein FXF65_15165 [Actinomadura syzygii]
MHRRFRALFSAAVLAAPLVVVAAPAASAYAAPYVFVSPTLDRDNPAHPVTVTVDVKGEGVARVRAWLADSQFGGSWAALGDLRLIKGTAQDGTWQGSVPVSVEEHPGEHWAVAYAEDANGRLLAQNSNTFQACYLPVYSGVKAAPAVADADHRTVTASGAISYRTSKGAAPRPASGLPVSLLGTPGTTETGADGRFTVGGDADRRPVLANAAKGVVCEGRETVPVTFKQTATAISARLSAPDPVPAGSTVTVRGELVRAGTGGPVFLGIGEEVQAWILPFDGGDSRYIGRVEKLGAGGSFEFSFAATPGELVVHYTPNSTGFFTQSEVRQPLEVGTARAVTAFSGANAGPEPVALNGTVTTSGRLLSNGAAVKDATVDVEFSANGTSGWTRVGRGTTDSAGAFSVGAPAARDGYWRVRYAGSSAYRPVVSGTDFVDARYATAISSFNAAPEPVRKGKALTVQGKLSRNVGGWKPGSGATVKIYFRRAGASSWTLAGTTRSASDGVFRKSFTAKQDGTWRAVYAGSATYMPVTGADDYVDVR